MGGSAYFDSETCHIADAREGSARLLALLSWHHDFNLSPPPKWKPRIVWVPKALPAVLPAPSKPDWFAISDLPEPKISEIRKAVCLHFDISRVNLDSQRRTREVVYPRHVAMYVARELTTKSLPEIGRQFGGRNHTTVLHGANKIEGQIRNNWLVAFDVAHIEAML